MAAGLEKNQEGNDNMQATVAGVDQERASLRQGAKTWDVDRGSSKGRTERANTQQPGIKKVEMSSTSNRPRPSPEAALKAETGCNV